MKTLPETNEHDLQIMGITPDTLKEALEKTDKTFHGRVVRLFFPQDNDKGDSSIHRARNYLKSGWTEVEKKPIVFSDPDIQEQRLNISKGPGATHLDLDLAPHVTTGVNYHLAKPFDVTVNANLPLGKEGPIPVTATDTAADVKNKSSCQTKPIHFSIPVDFPVGEGVTVDLIITKISIESIHRALIGVHGTVGVEIKPSCFRPSYRKYIYKIEDLFPNASAKSEIVVTHVYTIIEVIMKKAHGHEAGEIIQYLCLLWPDHIIDSAPLIGKISHWLTQSLVHGSPAPADFSSNLKVRVDFSNKNPIPVNQRDAIVHVLTLGIQSSAKPQGCIGFIEGATWQPDREARDQATFWIPFDPNMISRDSLIRHVLETSKGVAWNGPHAIHFA